MLLEGIFLPVLTPFYPDGRVYLRKLEHNVDRYSRSPAAGMLVLGPGSEGDGLTDDEARAVLVSAMAAAAAEKVMVAGVGRESVAATLTLAEAAAAADYDAIAVRGPAFVDDPAMHAEALTYFQAVADRAPLPVVLVSEAGRRIPLGVLAEAALHGNVLGVMGGGGAGLAELLERTNGVSREVTVTSVFQAATRRMLRPVAAAGAGNFVSAEILGAGGGLAVAPPAAAIKTRVKRVGFQVLTGTASEMLASWRAGATGALPALAACAPQACCEVWQAFKDGDDALAELKQERIRMPGERMEGWSGIAAVKHGCDLNGYFGGRPRLPLIALDAKGRIEVERELAGLRN